MNFIEHINCRSEELKQIIIEKERQLANAPEGTVNIAQAGKRIQYYYNKKNSESSRRYLKSSEIPLISALCQKDYDQKILSNARKELKFLERMRNTYPREIVEDIYEKLNVQRRKFVVPISITDDEFVEEWKNVAYQGKGFREDAPEFYTDKGERVRSKTEILIANALNKHGIPYRYECPIYLNGFGKIHPDFTVLNVRLRKEMFWEHMGMMDDSGYSEGALRRITMYERNDIFPGDKLILTHETMRYPISSQTIEKIIFQYLK